MTNVVVDWSFERRAAGLQRGVVTRSYYHTVVVLHVEERSIKLRIITERKLINFKDNLPLEEVAIERCPRMGSRS